MRGKPDLRSALTNNREGGDWLCLILSINHCSSKRAEGIVAALWADDREVVLND